MSRIGKKSISFSDKVEIQIEKEKIIIKGPKGELQQNLPDFVKVEKKDNQLNVFVDKPEEKKQRSCWGTFNVLISNMIQGVTEGFEKKLELIGVGYRAEIQENKLILRVGFSHIVEFLIPKDLEISVDQNTKISIKGIDKQLVGETAAQIRKIRKPEPYKGKGIRYAGEVVRRKSGKKTSTSGK